MLPATQRRLRAHAQSQVTQSGGSEQMGTGMTDTLNLTGASAAPKASKLAAALGGDAAHDYGDDGKVQATGQTLEAVQALAAQQITLQKAVADAEAALKKAKEDLADVEERRLPALMEQYNLPEFKFLDTTTGIVHTIKLDKGKYFVTMPPNEPENAGKRREIYQWLRTVGLGGIIKKTMQVPLGLVGDNESAALLADFKAAHPDLDPGLEEKVEAATLKSRISKRLVEGKEVHKDINVKPCYRAVVKAE